MTSEFDQELIDRHDRAVDRLRSAARILVAIAVVAGISGTLLGVAVITRGQAAAGGYLIGASVMSSVLLGVIGFWALLYATSRELESSTF